MLSTQPSSNDQTSTPYQAVLQLVRYIQSTVYHTRTSVHTVSPSSSCSTTGHSLGLCHHFHHVTHSLLWWLPNAPLIILSSLSSTVYCHHVYGVEHSAVMVNWSSMEQISHGICVTCNTLKDSALACCLYQSLAPHSLIRLVLWSNVIVILSSSLCFEGCREDTTTCTYLVSWPPHHCL